MNEQTKEQITAKAREFATTYTNRHFPNEPAFAFGNEGWAKFVDALVELAGTAPVVPAPEARELAHELGFMRCAGWAQRDDLFSDVTSQAYRKDRAHDLATIATTPQAAPVAQLSEPPEGWKLVPIEPTEKMRNAACGAWLDCGSKMHLNKAYAAAKAAIAAAPTTPKDAG